MKAKWLDRELMTGPYLILCLSKEAYLAALADLGQEPEAAWIATPQANGTAHTMPNTHDGKQAVVICIRNHEGRDGVEIAGLLIHEAVHVWQNWCAHIGEQNPGSEAEAYGIQRIAQCLMESFAAQTRS